MKGLKFFLILIFVFLLIGVSSANHMDRDVSVVIENSNGDTFQAEDTPEFVIDFGQNSPQPFRVAILCSGSDCPYGPPDSGVLREPLFLELCGKTIDATNNYRGSDTDFWTDKQKIPRGSLIGAKTLRCDPGIKEAEIVDQEGHVVKDVNTDFIVDYRTKGPQLAVSIDLEIGGDKINRFKIMNAKDYSGYGHVRLMQAGTCVDLVQNCGDLDLARSNTILSFTRSSNGQNFVDNLDGFVREDYADSYQDCGLGPSTCKVANKELKELESSCEGNCPIGYINQGDPADYIPRGEIIMGNEFSVENEWPSGLLQYAQFFVCDSSLNGYKEMDGRTVYSPGSDGGIDYFECRDDQWIERPQCEPGFKWTQYNGGWSCLEKGPTTVDVNFLELQNLPYQQIQNGYKAGFQIRGAEAEKFEDQYDAQLQEVTAECWMGEDDKRPSDVSDKGVVTVDVDDFRTGYGLDTIWALTEIPYRENVDNTTYSCVWGFNGITQRGKKVAQGVNSYLMKSMDHQEVDYYDYSQIKTIYEVNKDAYSNSIDWGFYRNDDRGYTPAKGPNPFTSPNEEYPYCPPDNPLYPEADIQCG